MRQFIWRLAFVGTAIHEVHGTSLVLFQLFKGTQVR